MSSARIPSEKQKQIGLAFQGRQNILIITFIIKKGSLLLLYPEREVLAQVNMWVICKTSARNKNEKGIIKTVGDVVDRSVFLLIIQLHFLNPLLFKLCISLTTVLENFRLNNEIKEHISVLGV